MARCVGRWGRTRSDNGGRWRDARAVLHCAGHGAFGVESLEQRTLLFAWTPQEVYLAELVNRARANPAVEGARLGLDLTAGLSGAELARLVAQEPLALNEALTRAARDHSLDMAARNFFSHTSPSPQFSTPTSRAQGYGYPGTVGENIAGGYTSVDAVHRAWLESLGHRKNVLSLHASFDDDFHYDELGVGLAFNAGGAYQHYFTQDFGYQGANPVRYILGVVFNDENGNNFYGIGEGAADIRVDVLSGQAVVGTYTTDAAGNYQIGVAPGSYTVRFTSLATGNTLSRGATVSTFNVKMDAELGAIDPPPLVDEHANAGQWPLASVIAIDPANGNGTMLGRFQSLDDTDLFRFTASVAGTYQVSVNAISANAHHLAVYNGSQGLVASVSSAGGGLSVTYSLAAQAGQLFYLLVSGTVVQINGAYIVLIQGPGPGGGDDPGGDDPGGDDPGGDDPGGDDPAPDEGHLAEAGLPMGGAVLVDGRLGVTYLSAELRPVFAVRNGDGTWERVDLLTAAGGPNVSSRIVSWVDTRDGVVYAAANSTAGLILYARDADGGWSVRNLSAELGKARIDGDLTVYVENNGRAHLAGLTATGRLVDYRMTAQAVAEGWRWAFLNVSNTHLRVRGRAMPALAGQLVSFVTPRGSWNVAGLDTQGRIQLFFKQKRQRWDVVNLSGVAGTVRLVGTITAYQVRADRTIGIVGTAATGNVWVTGFVEGAGWSARHVTQGMPIARKLRGGGVTSYVNQNGVAFVAGLNGGGKVVVYRYDAGRNRWMASLPTNLVSGGGPRLSGDLTATMAANGMGVSIVGQTSAGRIIRYFWNPGAAWQAEDVSALLAV